jgi:hypothetical protein
MRLKRFLHITPGIVTSVGDFLEIDSITTAMRIANRDLRHAK